MVKTVKRKNRQAPDAAKNAVRDDIINDDGTVTIHGPQGDYKVDFGEYMMAYAPLSLVRKICEPL